MTVPAAPAASRLRGVGNCYLEAFRKTVDSHLDNFRYREANRGMSSTPEKPGDKSAQRKGRAKPVWAEGLRRMYDEVVEEQLPDDFVALLKKLDENGDRQ